MPGWRSTGRRTPYGSQGRYPGRVGSRFVLDLGAVSFKKPVASAQVTMEGCREGGTPESFLQVVGVCLGLSLSRLSEVTKIGRS
jgi:hypothetical protein